MDKFLTRSPAPWARGARLFVERSCVLLVGLALRCSLLAAAPDTAVMLHATGTNIEGLSTYELSWDAVAHATYKIQSRTSIGAGLPWITEDLITPSAAGRFTMMLLNPPSVTDSGFSSSAAKFYRIELPTTEISRVEPAVLSAVGGQVFILGQCFTGGFVVRVDGVNVPTEFIDASHLRVTVPALPAGTHRIEILDGANGTVVATAPFGLETTAGQSHALTLPAEIPPAQPGSDASGKAAAMRTWANSFLTDGVSLPLARSPASDPFVALPTGELIVSHEDLRIPGRGFDLVWARTYRSRTGTNTMLGHNWDASYNIRVEQVGLDAQIFDGNGRRYLLRRQADGTFVAEGIFREGSNSNGAFNVEFSDSSLWRFHVWNDAVVGGKLRQIIDRNGNTMNFVYDAQARLVEIIDTLGRTNRLAYASNGPLESFTDFSGRKVRYAYYGPAEIGGSLGDLKSVTTPVVVGTPNANDFPLGKTTTYTYSTGFQDERLNHNLRSITDPSGQTSLQVEYHAASSPDSSDFDAVAGLLRGLDKKNIRRIALTPSAANGFAVVKAIVNDYVGNVGEYFYDSRNRLVLQRAFTGRAIPNQPTTEVDNRPAGKLRPSDPEYFETRYEWNADSLLTRLTRPRGNVTERIYEGDFDPQAAFRMRGNLRVERNLPCCGATDLDGDGVSDLVTVRYEHDLRFGSEGGADFATTTVDARGHSTLRWFDSRGNLTRIQHPLPGVVEDFEYNEFGQMTAQELPPDGNGCRRRDTFEYHSEPTAPGFGHLKKKTQDNGGLGCGQTDPFRLATSYEYDAAGNVTSIIGPRGTTNRFVVNALNQIVYRARSCISVEGQPIFEVGEDFTYDANDNLLVSRIENRDESGVLNPSRPQLWDAWEYDALNRCVRSLRGGDSASPGVTTEYIYDGNNNVVLVRQPEAVSGADPDNLVHSEYDERNLLFRRVLAPLSPVRSTNQWDYDANGNCTVQKEWDDFDALSRVTRCTFDGLDRLESVRDPLGNTVTNHYDLKGNLLARRWDGIYSDGQEADVSGTRLAESHFHYDPLDRPIYRLDAFFEILSQAPIGDGGRTTLTSYAPDGQVTGLTDDNGHTTLYSYDSAGRLLMVQDPKTNTVTYAYDGDNNVTSITQLERSDIAEEPQTFVTRYDYDSLNRLGRVTDGMTNVTRYGYDSRDNLVRMTDARGNLVRHEYDSLNRLIRSGHDLNADLDAFGTADIVTLQSWDANSRLRSQTDANLNATQYAYDSRDRLVRTTFADGTTETNAYDTHGNLVFKRDANGSAIYATYDLLNRLVGRSILPDDTVASDTTTETYRYDGLSRLVRAEDDDSVVTREHDSLNHLRREVVNGLATSSAYDAAGNRLALNYPGGRVATCTYDALNRPKIVSDITAGVTTDLATYQYIGPDRVTRRDGGNGIRSRFMYDGAQGTQNAPNDFGVRRLSHVRHASSGAATIIDERTFHWDRNQNKTERADVRSGGPGLQHSYHYDAADRLTLAEMRDSLFLLRSSPYPLDGVGNRVPGAVGLAPWGMSSAMPDPADYQMNQYTSTDFDVRSYDENGNTRATLLTLAWVWLPSRIIACDYRNQIVNVLDPFTGASTSYSYDALGRRFRKTEVSAGGESTVTTDFVYDNGNVIEERQEGEVSASYYHVRLPAEELLCVIRGAHRYFYHHDDVGNVMALSDENGALAERYEYLEFGEPQFYDPEGNVWLSSQVENPYLFHGLRYDDESGFYQSGNRSLDSQVGRFVMRDPMGMWNDPKALGNPFTYTGNNPWSAREPSGVAKRKVQSDEPTTLQNSPTPGAIAGIESTRARMAHELTQVVQTSTGRREFAPIPNGAIWHSLRHETLKNSISTIR